MTDTRPVFVLFTASTCPGCIHFKSQIWPHLRQTLEEKGRVQIIQIEVPTPAHKPDPSMYHKDLGRFVGFFPSVALFPADRFFDPTSELIGIIKNGKMVPPSKDANGRLIPEKIEIIGKFGLSEGDVLKWVDYTLDNPDGFFSQTSQTSQSKKQNSENELKNMKRGTNGKYMVPTAGHYNRLTPSRFDF